MVAYYRLLLPRLLPSVDRVIYLDSDIVVRHDLGEMWDTEMGGAACLAVQDMLTPYIDAAAAMPRFNIYGSLLIQRPILNFKSLDLSPTSPYFNSGILLLSLNRWRELDLSDSMIRCLHVNREFVNWTDQYALNVELAGRWDTLDPRWNQGSYIFEFPSWSFSALERRDFTLVRDHPHIVHFTSALKPWHANSPHPFRQEFFRYLDRTEWAGWRPSDDNSWSFWLWRQLSLIFTTTKHLRLRMQARYKLMREWASEMKAKLFATRSV